MKRAEVAIAGAGIAGIATAYYLSEKYGQGSVVLVDPLQPMAFTTARSGENFRDYWPQPCMAALAGHSIDLMESIASAHDDVFRMRFTGYDFVSESADTDIFGSAGPAPAAAGVRRCCDPREIRRVHPHLADTIEQVVHIERAGSMDVHALGWLLLGKARARGAELVRGRIVSIERRGSAYSLVLGEGADPATVEADRLVLAAGPFVAELARMLDVQLPTESFLQRKILIPDPDGVIPRDLPFTIFTDPQTLRWTREEADLIEGQPDYHWLLDKLPGGLHVKPESQDRVKLGWAINRKPESPRWSFPEDQEFPELVLRGASRFLPALGRYTGDRIPTPVVQYAGYYTRTPENWPLIGPVSADTLFVVGALSGFGTMCACAAGELCADSMMGGPLPDYAPAFQLDRYDDPAQLAAIRAQSSDGQL